MVGVLGDWCIGVGSDDDVGNFCLVQCFDGDGRGVWKR